MMRARRARPLDLVLAAVPVLFAVPVLESLASVFADTLAEPHPAFADLSGAPADARAVHFGVPLYQDPADGYTTLPYTPLHALAAAALHHLRLWDGWSLLLPAAGEAALVALAAWLAWDRGAGSRARSVAAGVGAVGVGAVALWLVTFVPFNFVASPRPDHLSWALALFGLVLVPAAARGSRRALVGSVLLLSAAVWTKQTAVPAAVAAAAWLWIAAARGYAGRGRAAAFTAALVAVNAAVFALLELLTDGWAGRLLVELPADRERVTSVGASIGDLFEAVGGPLAVALVVWGAVLLSHRVRVAEGLERVLPLASVLALFAVLDAPAAVYFRQAQGAAHNQYLGIAWALALLFAIAWALAQRRRASAAVAAAVIVVLFAVTESARLVDRVDRAVGIHVPPKSFESFVGGQPEALRRFADDRLVYHPAHPGLGARADEEFFPGQDNVQTLLWSGVQPRHLVRALLERRFELVYLFQNDAVRGDRDGYGGFEENYLWKLNELVKAKYRPLGAEPAELAEAAVVPPAGFRSAGVYERRPGADPAPWLAGCFGPFDITGLRWRIAGGGGFWCREAPDATTLRLVDTPAERSEIRADSVTLRSGASLRARFRRPGTLTVSLGSERVERRLEPGRSVTIALPPARGSMSITAPRGSGAEVDLGRL